MDLPGETTLSSSVLDIHIHLACIEGDGTGGWTHTRLQRSIPFWIIRRSLGLKQSDLPNLGQRMPEKLLHYLTTAPSLSAVALAMDQAYDREGSPLPDLTDLYVPNDFILSLAAGAERILPGVSIHPFRKDALEELERCHQKGAALVKWIPVSQNFSPVDEHCRTFYKELARLDIPLLCHTGSEGATRNIDKSWNNPRVLIPALESGVTVIAAHAGMRSSPQDRDYFGTWAAMLKDYPHLYGDTASVFGLRARRLAKALDKEHVVERLVHGSDWPVPASPWWFLGIIPLRKIRELSRLKNPLWREVETKRALGLPEDVFTRAWELIQLGKRKAQ